MLLENYFICWKKVHKLKSSVKIVVCWSVGVLERLICKI